MLLKCQLDTRQKNRFSLISSKKYLISCHFPNFTQFRGKMGRLDFCENYYNVHRNESLNQKGCHQFAHIVSYTQNAHLYFKTVCFSFRRFWWYCRFCFFRVWGFAHLNLWPRSSFFLKITMSKLTQNFIKRKIYNELQVILPKGFPEYVSKVTLYLPFRRTF